MTITVRQEHIDAARSDKLYAIFEAGRFSARCEYGICHVWPDRPHVHGMKVYCPEHCPCNAAPAERTAPVEGMAGEQMRLPT